MTREQHDADFGHLEPLLKEAVQATLVDPVPNSAVHRVKARARQLADPSVDPVSATMGTATNGTKRRLRRRRRSLVTVLTAAAVLLLIAVGGVLIFDTSAGQVFAQVVENINAAESLRVDTTMRLGRSQECSGRMYFEGDRLRIEQNAPQNGGSLVMIADTSRDQGIYLRPHDRIAQLTELDRANAKRFSNPIEQLRRANSVDANEIGEEDIDGRRTRLYHISKIDLFGMTGAGEMLVWVDTASELPVRIVVRDTDPKHAMEIRLENFVWNPRLSDELFSLAVPEEFELGTIAATPRPVEETDDSEPSRCTASVDGIVSRDRVPGHVVWNSDDVVTALLRDPEDADQHNRRVNELRQWNVKTDALLWSARVGGAGCLASMSDSNLLATVVGDEVQLRDSASGEVIRTWTTDAHLISLAFAPDGKTLAAGVGEWQRGGSGETGGVRLFDVDTGRLTCSVHLAENVTRFIVYSPDGRYLAVDSGSSIRLLDAETGSLVRIFPGYARADISPDSKTLACVGASEDKNAATINLYDIRDGALLKTLRSEAGQTPSWVLSIRFSPDGRLLAAADWNEMVTIWQISNGTRRSILDHRGGVHTVAFASDGSRIATGSEDKTLRLSNVPEDLMP